MTRKPDLEARVRGPKPLGTAAFLKRLRQDFPIPNVCYPGAGIDDVLECAFRPREIVYIDNQDPNADVREFAKGRKYVRGDFGKPPFRSGTFSAVFYQDRHANVVETERIIETLREGGVLIFSGDCCLGDKGKKNFEAAPQLRKLSLPYTHEYFTVFLKDKASRATAKNI